MRPEGPGALACGLWLLSAATAATVLLVLWGGWGNWFGPCRTFRDVTRGGFRGGW